MQNAAAFDIENREYPQGFGGFDYHESGSTEPPNTVDSV